MALLFDFYCPNCKVTLEAFVENHSEEKPECPNCGTPMDRLFPAPTWKWAAGSRGF